MNVNASDGALRGFPRPDAKRARLDDRTDQERNRAFFQRIEGFPASKENAERYIKLEERFSLRGRLFFLLAHFFLFFKTATRLLAN